MKLTKALVSGILGGIAISLSSAAYIMVKNSSLLLSSLMFSVGFLAVVIFDLGLFTDGVGSLFQRGRVNDRFAKFGITLLGNIIGALIIGALLQSREGYQQYALAFFSENYYKLDFAFFLRAILGGMLIFIGLHGYRKAGGGFAGCAILIFSVAMLPICDFEYTIFNATLITSSLKSLSEYTDYFFGFFFIILISAVGNAIGAMAFSLLYRYKDREIDLSHGLKAMARKKAEKDRKKKSKKSEDYHHHHHHSSGSINEKDYAEFEEFKRFKSEMKKREQVENEQPDQAKQENEAE